MDDGDPEPESILPQWVVYDHPTDFPSKWVVRRWTIGPGVMNCDSEVHLFDSLDAARAHVFGVYPGAYRLDRQPDDDPNICEVWL